MISRKLTEIAEEPAGPRAGTFLFDARADSNAGSPTATRFATVEIREEGFANSAVLDFDIGLPPSDTWTTYSMPFDAATWGVSQGVWDTILADTP